VRHGTFEALRPTRVLPARLLDAPTLVLAAAAMLRWPRRVSGVLAGLHRAAGWNPWAHARLAAVTPKALAAAWRLRRSGVTHVHAHFANTTADCAAILARALGVPFSFTAHAYDIYSTAPRLRNDTLSWKVRRAARIIAISDYGAAMLSALGCVLALNARERTGRGQFCETSLLQASIAFQAGEYAFYDDRPDMENGGVESRGRSALARAYHCRDGEWLFVSVSEAGEWRTLRKLYGSLPALSFDDAVREPPEGGLATALTMEFSKIDRADALAALARAGVPAAQVNHFHDLFEDSQVVANELVAEFEHAEWGRVRQTGILAKFSATPARVDHAAPLLGEHTDQILRDLLGYDAAKIAGLRARRVVK